ncbi:MAG: MarR family transcriptional regulator [Streptosporangiales bacterium]|nr:MarR family transcriptional regulator [Streptosporangiales bacterium]MBO0890587.1 MarR family transcriptional regulator [Acidothermales bacterium]
MVETETIARLRGVIARIARELNASATAEGLTPTQSSVLGLIAVRGPLGLTELADLEGLNPTMLSRVVGKLTELELIRRHQDPADLRAVRVEVTQKGKRLQTRIRSQRTNAVAECLDRLPAASAERLLAALPALEELAEELKKGHRPTGSRT